MSLFLKKIHLCGKSYRRSVENRRIVITLNQSYITHYIYKHTVVKASSKVIYLENLEMDNL